MMACSAGSALSTGGVVPLFPCNIVLYRNLSKVFLPGLVKCLIACLYLYIERGAPPVNGCAPCVASVAGAPAVKYTPPPLFCGGGFCMPDDVMFALYAGDYVAPPDDDYFPAPYDDDIEAQMRAGELEAIAAAAFDDGSVVPDVLSTGDNDVLSARGLAVEGDMPKDRRLRWWEFVAWEDSIKADWATRLRARPDVRALAIWHNKDIKDAVTGELKKTHLHLMAGDSHGRKWSRAQAMRFASSVLGFRPGPDDGLVRPVKSPSAYALYLTHSNAPEKVQYPRDAVMCFGGVDLDSVVGVVDNASTILNDIYAWVDEFFESYECLPAFASLVRYASAARPSWSRFLSTSAGNRAVRSYLRSLEFDLGLDGRGAGTLSLVRQIVAAEKDPASASALGVPARLLVNKGADMGVDDEKGE